METDRSNGEKRNKALDDEPRFSPRPNRASEIAWRPWGDEAFQEAEREGKPVLLSISAVWCHWCHVMDETTYSDPAVIGLANRLYVPVRVDSDRNPDINRRYNQGGWPTTAFLDHRGNLLAGSTYIPPETMRAALQRIAELYRNHEVDAGRSGVELFPSPSTIKGLDLGMVEEVGASLLRAWDRAYGGLGREPKFPQVDALGLALELYSDEGNGEYLAFARSTLEAMIRGNLLDKVEGGFFRYSTTRDWSVPHYEKMLSDNAGMIPVLLKAYGVTGAEVFRRTASETAAYILRTLSDGERRYFGSQDADEEYYLLDADGRKGRRSPAVDRTVYTDLAARAASSFLAAGAALGNGDYSSLALAALEYLWSKAFRPGEGMAHYIEDEGRARRWGLLEDGAEAASAFLAAYGHTGDRSWMNRAETLLELMAERHWSSERSLFLDLAPGSELPGLDPLPAELPAQSRAAHAMLTIWSYGGDGKWRELAGNALRATAPDAPAHGFLAAPFALATNLYLRGPLMARVAGPEAAATATMLKTAALSARARTVIMMEREVGTMDGKAVVKLCCAESCGLRTTNTDELKEALGIHPHIDTRWESPRPDDGTAARRREATGGGTGE